MARLGGESAGGRWLLISAALLWSAGGVFAKAIVLDGGSIAFYRSAFAGVALMALVRPADRVFRPALLPLGLAFGAMIGLYLGAMKATTAANAIFLQSTSTFWVVPLGLIVLGERPDRRALLGIGLATLGVVAIVGFGYDERRRPGEGVGVALGLASGLAFAAVLVGFRRLRDLDPTWLSASANLLGALALGAFSVATGRAIAAPTRGQAVVLLGFALVQMAIPYVLFSRGLRTVPAAEAGLLGLIEPAVAPIWVFLAHGEVPSSATVVGGAFLLGGVAIRYLPSPGPVEPGSARG